MDSNKEIIKKEKGITIGLLAAILVFLAMVFIFWRITDEIVLEKETGLDLKIFGWVSGLVSPATTRLMLFFTFFGSTEFILPAYILLAAFFYFYRRDKLGGFIIVAIGITSKGILYLLKNIFQRQRPLEPLLPDVMGYSYPSGHSFSAFTFFGLLAYMIWKTDLYFAWKWLLSFLFILIAACTGLSRIYLHVHFPSDVIASFCLAVIWLSISLGVVHYVESKRM